MKSYDVIVVGAGFAGVCLLYRLREAGLSAIALEAGDDVGGTWYWNRYPGARCDVHSLEYSYAFSEEVQAEWDWPERYAPQSEIQRYIAHVADRFDLRRDIRFNTRVAAATFDRDEAVWTVVSEDGARFQGQYCVMATGCLSTAKMPEIEGLERFKGPIYHTGQWPHEGVDFTGKRVGEIGTGSSGIQVIPCIAEQAESLHVFQRTAHYTIPSGNRVLPPDYVNEWKSQYPALRAKARNTRVGVLHDFGDSKLAETPPDVLEAELERRWQKGGNNFMYGYTDVLESAEMNQRVGDFVRAKVTAIIENPETARKLMPTEYPIGTKRVCIDTDYYATFNRDNVALVDLREEPITTVTEDGIATTKQTYPFDVLVFATGFDAMTGSLLAMDIRTSEGASLREQWNAGPRAYLGLAVADFPNLFIVTGPGSPSVFSNMVVSIEHDAEWITGCIKATRARGARTIEADPHAQDQWVAHCNELTEGTLFNQAQSWYIGANVPGKPRVFMPYLGGVDVYQRTCREVAQQDYRGFLFDETDHGTKAANAG